MGEKQSSPVWGPMPYGPCGGPIGLHKSFRSSCSAYRESLLWDFIFVHTLRIQIIFLWRCKSRLCTSTFNLVVMFFFNFFPKIGLSWRPSFPRRGRTFRWSRQRSNSHIYSSKIRYGLFFNPEGQQCVIAWVSLAEISLQKREVTSDQPFEYCHSSVLSEWIQ